jgi:hypothetical protein
MFVEILGITYRYRILRWYQKNLVPKEVKEEGIPFLQSVGLRLDTKLPCSLLNFLIVGMRNFWMELRVVRAGGRFTVY